MLQHGKLDKITKIKSAYKEWCMLPMPTLDQNHIFDRPKPLLEDQALRCQVAMVAGKYGITYAELDSFIGDPTQTEV